MDDHLVALCAASPEPLPGPPCPNGTPVANAVTPNASQYSPHDDNEYIGDGLHDDEDEQSCPDLDPSATNFNYELIFDGSSCDPNLRVVEHIGDDLGLSKQKKLKSAMGHMNDFLKQFQNINQEKYHRPHLKAEDLTYDPTRPMEAEWWDDVMGMFVNYLCRAKHRTKHQRNSYLGIETATGYASSMKTYFANKFKTNYYQIPVFRQERWAELKTLMVGKFHKYALEEGTKLHNPHLASTADDRKALGIACVWANTAISAEFWHLNNSMTHCVGRGSEVALQLIENIGLEEKNEFNMKYKVINVTMKKSKKGFQQSLPIYPHRDYFYEDYYFSLLYLLKMNEFRREAVGENMDRYLFPDFSSKAAVDSSKKGMDSKVSKHWTHLFKELKSYFDMMNNCLVNMKLTSHHGKKGSNQKMSEVPLVSGLAQIFRSGWMVRGLHSLFDYVVGLRPHVSAAGKAISDWTMKINDQLHGGVPPNLNHITTDSHLVLKFVDCIFHLF